MPTQVLCDIKIYSYIHAHELTTVSVKHTIRIWDRDLQGFQQIRSGFDTEYNKGHSELKPEESYILRLTFNEFVESIILYIFCLPFSLNWLTCKLGQLEFKVFGQQITLK